MIVFGTRPEAIKMVPIIEELNKFGDIDVVTTVTAQHREMLDQVLGIFSITPDYDLDIMKDGQTLSDVTSSVLLKMEKILRVEKPDILLVQGDTTTTFSAGLSAYYVQIPVGHLEAGLRTGNKYNPFPEEMNRRFVDSLSDLHFAATQKAKDNLLHEGFTEDNIHITGNTGIDALLTIIKKKPASDSHNTQLREVNFEKKIILVTAHRRENHGDPLKNICKALATLANSRNEIEIVYPVHPNPNVFNPVRKALSNIKNVHLIEPMDYCSFVHLMNRSYLILTDSGGIQEEAPSLGKPVLVLRDTTERIEALEAGTAKLVGTHPELIVDETQNLLDNRCEYEKMAKTINPYGDGKAAKRIVKILRGWR